ncbi:phospholipase A2 inhibitor gamma subunit B-like [Phyllobates terribilis]|uniref:phospholipase A2 inhibitor gamma subunit B-like n=1 Tax=Phyllobates terribilis TaxID=111132 RepID=UPI003CCB36F7
MKSSCLLFFCVLWSIAATDVPISCLTCVGETVNSCYGSVQNCSSATEECISVFEEAKVEMRTTTLFMRFCGNCSQQQRGFVRFDKGILKINATCCNNSDCTPPVPTVPLDKPVIKDDKFKSNGKSCNTCHVFNVTKCDCNIFLECIGEEKKCMSRYISGPHNHAAVVRGCATTEMCGVTKSTEMIMNIDNNEIISKFSCSDDSESIHSSLLLLVLAAALFSKFTTDT